MFTPSSAKVRAAERYLDEVRARKRETSFVGFNKYRPDSHGKLWRRLPEEWHPEAEAMLNRLTRKYWETHGHGPSQQKQASLIGNVVWTILYCRITNDHLTKLWKFWNARMVVRGNKNIRRPNDRTGFTPTTTRARSSPGNLIGI